MFSNLFKRKPKAPHMNADVFNMRTVLVDKTEKRTSSDMNLLRDSVDEFMQIVAQYYGGSCAVRIAKNVDDVLKGEVAANIRAKLADAPDAVAYHTATAGVPDIELALEATDSWSKGSDSVSCAMMHEYAETKVDPGGNLYVVYPSAGKARPREACDRVQNITFRLSTGADATNFLLQNAYMPDSDGPWDYVSSVTGTPLMSDILDYKNGYDMEADIGNEKQLLPMKHVGLENLSALAQIRKAAKHSRLSRRLHRA